MAGGVSAFFGDQLSDQMIATAIQANGTVRDIGGAVYYTNLRNRWNYGAGLEHVPYLTGGIFYGVDTINGNLFPTINQVLERIYIDQASVFSQYPFDQTRRVEFNVSATRLGFQAEVDKLIVDQSFSQVLGEQRQSLPAPPAIYYAQPEIAFVGDKPGDTGLTMTMGVAGLGGGEGDAHGEDGVSAAFVELGYAD